MRIQFREPAPVPFSTIGIGGTFYCKDRHYLKVRNFWDASNAVSLLDGSLEEFSSKVLVQKTTGIFYAEFVQ